MPAQSTAVKRKRETDSSDEDEFSHDEVRLWEDGFKDRYYESKFAVSPTDLTFRTRVAREYVTGLSWVLQYYYQVIAFAHLRSKIASMTCVQGVPSWKWYFPYHYAPFASDFDDILSVPTHFEKNTVPVSVKIKSYMVDSFNRVCISLIP